MLPCRRLMFFQSISSSFICSHSVKIMKKLYNDTITRGVCRSQDERRKKRNQSTQITFYPFVVFWSGRGARLIKKDVYIIYWKLNVRLFPNRTAAGDSPKSSIVIKGTIVYLETLQRVSTSSRREKNLGVTVFADRFLRFTFWARENMRLCTALDVFSLVEAFVSDGVSFRTSTAIVIISRPMSEYTP